jgi:hypothetical protein
MTDPSLEARRIRATLAEMERHWWESTIRNGRAYDCEGNPVTPETEIFYVLGPTQREINALRNAGYTVVGDLIDIRLSRLHGIGKRAIAKINAVLAAVDIPAGWQKPNYYHWLGKDSECQT